MSDGRVVDTERAFQRWEERTRRDRPNLTSLPTGSQWERQTLFRTRDGRYYVVHESQHNRVTSGARWLSNEDACRWLLLNGYQDFDDEFPDELKELMEESWTK